MASTMQALMTTKALTVSQRKAVQQAWSSAEHFYSQATCEDPRDSVRASYLAALKAAGAVVASYPSVQRTRPITRDVWVLLGRLDPCWNPDIDYFRRWDGVRRDIELGLPVAVSSEQADEFFHQVGGFMDRVLDASERAAA